MCIAIAKPAGVHINREVLRECFQRNADGAGFMYCGEDGTVQIRKPFFKFKQFYAAYRQAEHEAPESPFGLHFRIATSGELDKENSHPHRVSRNMALIHNGILSIAVPKGSPHSDTVLFNRGVFQQLPANFDEFPGIVWLLEKFVGYSNKIVVLKGDGQFVILNEKSGHWNNGAWFSNYSYKAAVVTAVGGSGYMGRGVSSAVSDHEYFGGSTSSRAWCRGCLFDLTKGENEPYCDMCREITRLTDDAKDFPRYVKNNESKIMDRATEVATEAAKRIESCKKRGLAVTAERIRGELAAMVRALGRVVPLALGPGDVSSSGDGGGSEAATDIVEVAAINSSVVQASSGPALPPNDGDGDDYSDREIDMDDEGGVVIAPESDTEALWQAYVDGGNN